ncbi:MAG: NAD-binding protein [Caldilineaceae bacterium]
MLQRLDLAFVVIELDQYRVEEAKVAGLPVIYGDAGQEVVLEAAHVADARLLLVTTPDMIVTQSIVTHVQHLNPDVHIVARAGSTSNCNIYMIWGSMRWCSPSWRRAWRLRQALLHLWIPVAEINRYTDTVRHELYAPIYDVHEDYQLVHQLRSFANLLEFSWVQLPTTSPLIGRALGDLRIRTQTGVIVVGIVHWGHLHTNPAPDYQFEAGDFVAVMGDGTQLAAFERFVAVAEGI